MSVGVAQLFETSTEAPISSKPTETPDSPEVRTSRLQEVVYMSPTVDARPRMTEVVYMSPTVSASVTPRTVRAQPRTAPLSESPIEACEFPVDTPSVAHASEALTEPPTEPPTEDPTETEPPTEAPTEAPSEGKGARESLVQEASEPHTLEATQEPSAISVLNPFNFT